MVYSHKGIFISNEIDKIMITHNIVWGKEARPKRVHTVWFLLYEVQKEPPPNKIYRVKALWVEGNYWMGESGFWGQIIFHFLNWVVSSVESHHTMYTLVIVVLFKLHVTLQLKGKTCFISNQLLYGELYVWVFCKAITCTLRNVVFGISCPINSIIY